MAAINYVPGVGFVRNVPGTDRTVVMGSAEDRVFQEQADKRREELFSHQFDYAKDYRGLYDKLFNADNKGTNVIGGFSTGGYNQGGWNSDLKARLENISKQGLDFLENPNAMYGFGERNRIGSYGSDIFDRNNAIMDMYRRGYDKDQISDHLAGKKNVLTEQPSWRDYQKDKKEAGAGLNWTDGFFIGGPDQNYQGFANQRMSRNSGRFNMQNFQNQTGASGSGVFLGLPGMGGFPGSSGQNLFPYTTITDGRVFFNDDTTNLQFVNALGAAGLISDDDARWFNQHFQNSTNNWLVRRFNDPTRGYDFNKEENFKNLSDVNFQRFMRLQGVLNPFMKNASIPVGGVFANPNFPGGGGLNLNPEFPYSPDNPPPPGITYSGRPVFIGQAPSGRAGGESVFYTAEDTLLRTDEMPDLYRSSTPPPPPADDSDAGMLPPDDDTQKMASGGIVSLAMNGMDMPTGQGIETFLNRDRSKAALQRNLQMLAQQQMQQQQQMMPPQGPPGMPPQGMPPGMPPQGMMPPGPPPMPPGPPPTMQQGIMPMAG
jgi:hypothetical protein